MEIIKNINDYKFSAQQRVFASFLKENLSSYTCDEKITNIAYLKKYFSPEHDFTIYSTGIVDANLLLRKAN
jgi:hypothetical protein